MAVLADKEGERTWSPVAFAKIMYATHDIYEIGTPNFRCMIFTVQYIAALAFLEIA